MKADLKAKWVEALRSGKYEQGYQSLRCETGEYCCLGVLLDVSGLGDWRGSAYTNTNLGPMSGNLCGLGPVLFEIWQWEEDQLVKMNDKKGLNFLEIADWIEANL